jgi:hypothetical protein
MAMPTADGADMGTTVLAIEGGAEGSARRDGGRNNPRYTRRLSDKILIAFHHACDQADFEVAEQLLQILDMMLTRRPLTPDGSRRRNMESLVAAHERLWHLRHPESEDTAD